jgi:hypothetical protein
MSSIIIDLEEAFSVGVKEDIKFKELLNLSNEDSEKF